MEQLTDLEDLGFDVTFHKHDTHKHRYTCTVRRWNVEHTNFKQGTFQWISEPENCWVRPSDRLRKFFVEHFFDIERITGLKINWRKYDEQFVNNENNL